MDWTNGPLDYFLDYFLDHFLDYFLNLLFIKNYASFVISHPINYNSLFSDLYLFSTPRLTDKG